MDSGRKTLCLLDKLSNIFSRVFLSTTTVFPRDYADSSRYRLATTRVTQLVFNKSGVYPHNPLLFIQINGQSVKSQLYDSIENRCRKPVAIRKSTQCRNALTTEEQQVAHSLIRLFPVLA